MTKPTPTLSERLGAIRPLRTLEKDHDHERQRDLDELVAENQRLEHALWRIANGQNLRLLTTLKPNGEWTERHEVYENIARNALEQERELAE